VAGALQKSDYIEIIQLAGFSNLNIHKEKIITVPENLLLKYLSSEEIESFKHLNNKILSITVSAKKVVQINE
jgi:hypothetical protein